MSKSRLRLYIESSTFIVGKAGESVPCLSIMLFTISADRMHMLLLFWGCSKIVKKSLNVGFVSMFLFRIGPSEDDIVSTRGVRSMIPSQQRRGLLRRLVSVISSVEKS
jgi:hypothetical protein